MKQILTTICLLLFIALAVPLAQAETVWKWVDDNGVTQYTDKASVPEGVPSEEVALPEVEPSGGNSQNTTERLQKQADILEQERKQREKEAEAADRARALEESQAREEIFVEPKKKKKKRKKSRPRPIPPPPKPDPKPPPPSFNQ